MTFAVICSNYPECSTKTEGDLNNERDDRKLGQRLIRHNRIHWCSRKKGERSRVEVIFEEIMTSSFPELMKATTVQFQSPYRYQ